jgi:protein-arginine kinase activator protein McsA
METVKILFYGLPVPLELRDKSEKELYKLLSINKSLEEFEKCAEIRDELKRRKEMEVGA